MREIARRLRLNSDALDSGLGKLSALKEVDWSNAWQDEIVGAATTAISKTTDLQNTGSSLLASLQIQKALNSRSSVDTLVNLTKSVLETYRKNLSFAFEPAFRDQVDAWNQLQPLITEFKEVESSLSTEYTRERINSIDTAAVEESWTTAVGKFWLLSNLAKKKVIKELAENGACVELPDPSTDAPRLKTLQQLDSKIQALAPSVHELPGADGLDSNAEKVVEHIALADQLLTAIARSADTPSELVDRKTMIRRLVVEANELLSPESQIALASIKAEQASTAHEEAVLSLENYGKIDSNSISVFQDLIAIGEHIISEERRLNEWCAWQKARQEALQWGLGPLVESVENKTTKPEKIEPDFLTAYCKWFAKRTIDTEPLLREFVAAEHYDSIKEFRRIDDKVAKLTADYTRAVLAKELPDREAVGKRDGYGILKHELQKKRRHKPLRQLAGEMGDAFGTLAPCMLMSPLSIAQYLPAEQELFDLVIFDEASQITPWDAVGSIARGKQVIIAGDPRQMPPTNFFQRGAADSEFDSDTEGDLESILDECLAVGIPRHSLSWHYRSRHESLIAFSNHNYYGGNLITFPAAETKQSAVTWRKVNGIYAKGQGRTNQKEAEAVVEETVGRLLNPEFLEKGHSIGIITLNTDQQKLIEDLLDSKRKAHPEIEPFFDHSLSEPVFVKNLETVQGDERDIILLSIGYGPTEPHAQTMSMNFGPLNRDGGERRLNVALTRSRHEMIAFTSFDSSMIDLNRTSARAVRDLKHFIEFADRGPRALAEAVQGSLGSFDSPFEESVANRLQEKGWQVVPQVGVSRFRIDLGIVHPDRPGDFLAGVECDGATYHSAATARDRDKVRAAVLEGLGWELLRVWSTDWFINPERELVKLEESLRQLHSEDSARREALEAARAEKESSEIETDVETEKGESPPSEETALNEQKVEWIDYQFAVLSKLQLSAESFHDENYTEILKSLVEEILQAEAPIADSLLVRRVARAHDFGRAGRIIRERVLDLADEYFFIQEDPIGGQFVWLSAEQSSQKYHTPRKAKNDEEARKIEEISSIEIQSASGVIQDSDRVRGIARAFGTNRLSATTRERIENALSALKDSKQASKN
ncbi:DUF3320 domain-containing protein [Akkermansiaceae bacterium]|nr:DUF3320 domain-containing protein [Akkermansiaceae bacterium]